LAVSIQPRTLLFALLPLLMACSSAEDSTDDADEALTESPIRLTTEDELAAGKFEGEILDYYRSHSKRGSFYGAPRPDGVRPRIVYDVVAPDAPSRGALVVVHGMDENSVKYAELVYDLHQSGLALTMYLVNHRGQGFSDRLLPDEPKKCHVDHFESYIDDLSTFVDTVVRPDRQRNLFAFGHSMGGGILTRYLERYPDVFHHVVLSSPMHGVNTGNVPAALARALTDVVGTFDRTSYFPVQAPAVPFTTSPQRDEIHRKVYRLYPEAETDKITWGWLRESLDETRGPLKEHAREITADVRIFRAPVDDLVSPPAQDAICAAINAGRGNCEMTSVQGARHEVWNERDDIRRDVLTQMIAYYMSHMR
jgi:lysophospholipase